ncbi:MAG: hypothetical protein JWM33_1269 [Caulobacteraceae bacterium]|nr:hypothetical protein [Caulobacteraceae bacterium]
MPNLLSVGLAIGLGLAAGSGAWLMAGASPAGDLSADEAILARPPPASAPDLSRRARMSLGQLATKPLFTPPTETAPVKLALQGLARVDGRASALIAIDGAPAAWMRQGESRGGIRLAQVAGAGAVVDTPEGRQTLSLAQPSPAAPRPGGGPSSPVAGQSPAPRMAPGAAQAEAQIQSVFGARLFPPPPVPAHK